MHMNWEGWEHLVVRSEGDPEGETMELAVAMKGHEPAKVRHS